MTTLKKLVPFVLIAVGAAALCLSAVVGWTVSEQIKVDIPSMPDEVREFTCLCIGLMWAASSVGVAGYGASLMIVQHGKKGE